jgi:hypothetical protein
MEEVILLVAMQPITGSDGRPVSFALMDGDRNNRWLIWHSGRPAALCPLNMPLVFVLPHPFGPGPRAFAAAARRFSRH